MVTAAPKPRPISPSGRLPMSELQAMSAQVVAAAQTAVAKSHSQVVAAVAAAAEEGSAKVRSVSPNLCRYQAVPAGMQPSSATPLSATTPEISSRPGLESHRVLSGTSGSVAASSTFGPTPRVPLSPVGRETRNAGPGGSALLPLASEGGAAPRLLSEVGGPQQARVLGDIGASSSSQPRLGMVASGPLPVAMPTRGRLPFVAPERTPESSPGSPTRQLSLEKKPSVQAQYAGQLYGGSMIVGSNGMLVSPLPGQRQLGHSLELPPSSAFQFTAMPGAPGLRQPMLGNSYGTGLQRTASPRSGLQRTASPIREQILQQAQWGQVSPAANAAQMVYASPNSLAAHQGLRRTASPIRFVGS